MSNMPSKGTALITGASSGIGAVYADRLAKRGYDLILVARSEARLKSLSERLTKETAQSARALRANLNDKADLAKVEGTLRDDPTIAMLVNNAGTASITPLLNSDVATMDDMIALNVRALTRLTYAAAPKFVARGAGTIINIASVVGVSPETLNGVYGATKAYVLALSHSLQHELADKGIRVQAVLPGATATDIWELAGLPWRKSCPRPSSCRWTTWSMRRCPGSTRANWSLFHPSKMETSGPVSRPRAAPSPSASETRRLHLDTGAARTRGSRCDPRRKR
jgi:short-subunit dehydrogenase